MVSVGALIAKVATVTNLVPFFQVECSQAVSKHLVYELRMALD